MGGREGRVGSAEGGSVVPLAGWDASSKGSGIATHQNAWVVACVRVARVRKGGKSCWRELKITQDTHTYHTCHAIGTTLECKGS